MRIKREKIGFILLLLGIAGFFTPLLIKAYQCDILLGVVLTGVIFIATSLILIVK